MSITTKLGTATLGSALLLTLGAGMAQAATVADGNTMATLRPVALNGVKASGTAMVTVNGNRIDVTMAASGLLPDSPHAAHIHFGADARNECPQASDDKDGSGTLNTTEGGPAYGPIVVSLTKTGDTSPKSGLAVDRFDTAPGGKISYERGSITVSPDVAQAITDGKSVVVVHGVDHNNDGKYDGDTKSDLDPSLPTEATDPAICGVLAAAPAGGVQTGGGGTSTPDNTLALALGGGLILAAVGTGAFAARKATNRL
ncbi:CHRD domain-containing protein [Nostocoides sp. Soil756]|uniref:CHRD domain-containing protein n=1 Tax=Nostocoides sp. Soil756 TaxID=1736399 RepID=UPI0009E8073D|nr:CHRD domain-containing protein [Tetrasphaera sp. Soil756]